MFSFIQNRMPGGIHFNRIKWLKKHNGGVLNDYLEWCKYKYWHGYTKNYFKKIGDTDDYIEIEDLRYPQINLSDIDIFWAEFPDIVLPYIVEKQGIDRTEIERFYIEGPYELNNVKIEKDDVVVDCGANMGLFSVIASKKAKKVYAFEPDPEIIEKYLKFSQKQYANIEIQRYALYSESGSTSFTRDCNNVGAGKIGEERENSFSVDTITLDEFVEKNGIEKIDFIKADIEGAERELLKGSTKVLKYMRPKLSICTYHLPDDKEVLERIILDANPDYVVEHHYLKLYAYVP